MRSLTASLEKNARLRLEVVVLDSNGKQYEVIDWLLIETADTSTPTSRRLTVKVKDSEAIRESIHQAYGLREDY